jgi:hypothetical protein
MGRIGKAIRDVVIILGITLALLGGIELGIRWYAGPVAFQSDDEVIATLKPNVEKVFVRSVDGGPQYIYWRTNADGFRGPELLDDPSLRVIVYGDSNIQGRFSVLEDTFVGQLQRLLRGALDENVEVINAGICGYGPDQSLLRFQRELDDYRPDVVVLHIFADNDFGDLIRNRLFDVDENGGLVRTSHPFTEDLLLRPDWWNGSIRETIKNLKLSMWPGEIVRGMVRSRVPDQPLVHDPEAFRERSLERIEAEFEVYANGEPRSVSWMADNYDADIALAPDSQSAQAKMALMAATLKSAAQTAAEASVRLVVLIQPASQDITTNVPNHHEQLARFPEYDPRRMTQFLVDTCEAAGIEYIDLYETFTEVDDPGSLYFRIDDNHWNEAGQLVAAKVTAERLLGDLAEPPGPTADR